MVVTHAHFFFCIFFFHTLISECGRKGGFYLEEKENTTSDDKPANATHSKANTYTRYR